jgi:tetratricopeptide (TPR) repeat protein
MFYIFLILINFTTAKDTIVELIDQEIVLLQNKSLSLNYEYRLFELYIEKVKRLRVLENSDFLKEIETNPSANRDLYFIHSKRNSQLAFDLGLNLLNSELPSTEKAQILYALGLECIDQGQEKQAAEYLNKAGILAPNNIEIQSSRADALFNIKKFKDAESIYSQISKVKDNPFRTKIMHQYAWTKFKNGQFDNGLDAIEEAYLLNQNQAMVNNIEEVTNTLINFYAVTNNGERGINFFIKQNLNTKLLLKAAKRFRINGLTSHTNKLYSLIRTRKISKEEEQILLNEEVLSAIHNKEESILFNKLDNVIQLGLSLDEEVKIEAENYLKENFTIKAQMISKKFESNSSLNICEKYIHFLSLIDASNKCVYEYQLGDLRQATNNYTGAISSYQSSFKNSKEGCLINKTNDVLNTFLTFIDEKRVKGNELTTLKFYTYENYIIESKNLDKKRKVYLNYISLFNENNKYDEAYVHLKNYANLYPNDNDAKNLFKYIFDKFFELNAHDSVYKMVQESSNPALSFDESELIKIQERWVDVQLKVSADFFNNKKFIEALNVLEKIEVTFLNNKVNAQILINKSIINFQMKNYINTLNLIDQALTLNPEIYTSLQSDKIAEILIALPVNHYDIATKNVSQFITNNCDKNSGYKVNLIDQYFYFLVSDHDEINYLNPIEKCIPQNEKSRFITKELNFHLSMESFDKAEKLVEFHSNNNEFLKSNIQIVKSLMWNNENLINKWSSIDNLKKILSQDYAFYQTFQNWKTDVVKLNTFVNNLKLNDEKSWMRLNRALDDLAYFTSKSKKFVRSNYKLLMILTLKEQIMAMNNIILKINKHSPPSAEVENFKTQIAEALTQKVLSLENDIQMIEKSNMMVMN